MRGKRKRELKGMEKEGGDLFAREAGGVGKPLCYARGSLRLNKKHCQQPEVFDTSVKVEAEVGLKRGYELP